MTRTLLIGRLLAPLLALLAGCATVDRLGAPPLAGTPAESALVVVKVDASMHGMLGVTTSQSVNGGVLLGTDGTRRVEGKAFAGLIVFSNVPPGAYNLAAVETSWTVGAMTHVNRYAVPPWTAIELAFSVGAGETRFVGPVAVQEFRQTDQRGVRFSLTADPQAEREAWAKIVAAYPDSPWTALTRRRQPDAR